MQNDMYKLRVLCGRDVEEGKCAGKRGKKTSASVEDKTEGKSANGSVHDKTEGKSDSGSVQDKTKGKDKEKATEVVETKFSKVAKERWEKKKQLEKQRIANQTSCPFRLWATWMSTE
nr:hypothetical protein [Tanacetum cinerariifolium]